MVQGNLLGKLKKKSIITKLPGLAYSGNTFWKRELFTWLTFHFQQSDHKAKDWNKNVYFKVKIESSFLKIFDSNLFNLKYQNYFLSFVFSLGPYLSVFLLLHYL